VTSLLFTQTRVGQHGRTFTILKLRTLDEEGRVTRPFLRHTGLDELPQLWNVLQGDMALFGPRPEVPEKHAVFEQTVPGWDERLLSKPGILALAQVSGVGRNCDRFTHESRRRQLALDLEQIYGPRLRTRLRIIARLPGALLRGQQDAGSEEAYEAQAATSR
jgi:lipopolysaccharide/colanic/teichoic acid biosynthesis glycosyltransferase